jgi:hypothetical protein
MKLLALSQIFVALFVLSGGAQEMPVTSTVNALPDGYVTIEVKNESLKPLAAMVIFVNRTPLVPNLGPATTVRFVDCVLNSADSCMMPGDAKTFTFGGPSPGPNRVRVEPTVEAVVLEDGTMYGDPKWAEALVRQRRLVFRHLGKRLRMLHSALELRKSRDAVIQEFESAKQEELVRSAELDERRIAEGAFSEVRLNIERAKRADGSLLPIGEVIQALIDQSVRQRQKLATSKPDLGSGEPSIDPL